MLAIDGTWDGTLTTETSETAIPWSLRHRAAFAGNRADAIDASPPVRPLPADAPELFVAGRAPGRVRLLEGARGWLVVLLDDESVPASHRLLVELRRCGDRLVGRWWRLAADGRRLASGVVRGALRSAGG
jgi:hypothetical protein